MHVSVIWCCSLGWCMACFVIIFLILTAALGSKGEIHILQLKKTVPQREQGHSYC